MAGSAFPGRWAARALLVCTSGFVVIGGVPALAAAGPAVSSAAATLTLNNDGADVTTANGQSWILSVADDNVADTLTVGIERAVSAGGTGAEGHVWYFDSKASSLKFNQASGTGTLKGGSATSPVATIDLTFTATSHKAATCTSGSETVYTGTLSGEAELVTGLSGGGTVGGKSVTFNAKDSSPQVLVDSDCVPPLDECTALISFASAVTAAMPEAAGLDGTEAGTKVDFVSVASKTTLSSPKDAYRVDDGLVDTSPPKWDPGTKVLSVSTSSAGLVTGSAMLSGGTAKTTTIPCSYKSKSYTLKETDNTTANYASPAGESITAHTSLTGNLVAPATKNGAEYVIVTVSK